MAHNNKLPRSVVTWGIYFTRSPAFKAANCFHRATLSANIPSQAESAKKLADPLPPALHAPRDRQRRRQQRAAVKIYRQFSCSAIANNGIETSHCPNWSRGLHTARHGTETSIRISFFDISTPHDRMIFWFIIDTASLFALDEHFRRRDAVEWRIVFIFNAAQVDFLTSLYVRVIKYNDVRCA